MWTNMSLCIIIHLMAQYDNSGGAGSPKRDILKWKGRKEGWHIQIYYFLPVSQIVGLTDFIWM